MANQMKPETMCGIWN